MTSNRRLELLMQRAADGELTPSQRHELMDAAEAQPDGWKQLACTFLEEQLVRQNFQQNPQTADVPEETVVQPLKKTGKAGFWYQHPALSTAVTICLAFVLGLAVPWERQADPRGVRQVSAPLWAGNAGTGVPTDELATDSQVRQRMQQRLVELSGLVEELARSRSGN